MEKSARPIRNRKQSRKAWPPGDIHRPIKRLFTPDIKKMLKDWLIRRRDNPYPSRDEKKLLAYNTGLTYTQIANWFANWRRKLKNSGQEPPIKKSWGNLIKNYNTSAKGNVEQFSISSSDSIWEGYIENSTVNTRNDGSNVDDKNLCRQHKSIHYDTSSYTSTTTNSSYDDLTTTKSKKLLPPPSIKYLNKKLHSSFIDKHHQHYQHTKEHKLYKKKKYINKILYPQCFQISSTTTEDLHKITKNIEQHHDKNMNYMKIANKKYKHELLQKYFQNSNNNLVTVASPSSSSNHGDGDSPELSKWLESTANFTPNKNNYIEWNQRNKLDKKLEKSTESLHNIHQKDELDAAEVLANLANNYRQRMFFNIENTITKNE